jgi:hypothetical protein
MIIPWKVKTILILALAVVVSGCATCARDPVFDQDRGKADPLTAVNRCTEKVLW